jgi:hypothetical protein
MAASGLKGIKCIEVQSKFSKNIHPVIKCLLAANEMFNFAKKLTYGSN